MGLYESGREKLICVVTSLGIKLSGCEGLAKVIDLEGDSISAPEEL